MSKPALNYTVHGQGPPLLLVHGFVISFNIWRKLLPLLCPRFMLVMIELPGMGESPMPAEGQDYVAASMEGIEEVRLALGIEKWNVLGYSSGSRIAEAYIQTHAGSVGQAIFLCPLKVDALRLQELRLALRIDRSFPAIGDWVLTGWRLKFLVSLLGFNLKRDPLCEEWYAEISAAPMRARKDTIRAMSPVAGRSFSVPVPFELIWADKDLVTARPRRPGPQDHFVHGQHAAPMEAAEQVGPAIISILDTAGRSLAS